MRRLAMLVLVLGWTAMGLAEDTVDYTGDGGKRTTARGNIREESKRELVIQAGNDRVAIEVPKIISIKYDNQPPELVTIRAKERLGRYAEAAGDYTELGKSIDGRDANLQAEVAFSVFRCLAEQAIADPAKADAALAWHEKYGKEFEDRRQYYDMRELMGRVLLAKGDGEGAARQFAALEEVDWPGFREKAAKYAGIAALGKGDLEGALAHFDKIIEGTGTDEASEQQRNAALVYKADILVRRNEPADAEKLLRVSLPKISDDNVAIKALGYNTLGDALRATTKNDKLAMLDGYLWVNVLYDRDSEQLARSLYNLTGIFRSLGQPERADELAARLKTDFPESPWTKKLSEQTP